MVRSNVFFFDGVDLKGNGRACCRARQMYNDYIPAKIIERARTGPLVPCIEPYIALIKRGGLRFGLRP